MVKNVKGGSGHKSQARKFVEPSRQVSAKTRLVREDGELYAQVTALLGNGMCHVLCQDQVKRLCIIRGKFRGRGKRDNTLTVSKWVMVGLRDESTRDGKLENCDLLEVYSDLDKERLKVQAGFDFSKFIENDRLNSHVSVADSNIEFVDEREIDYEKIMEMPGNSNPIQLTISETNEDEEVNIDDI